MSKETSPYRWEYTDTFGREANYTWVRRGVVRVPSAIDRKSNATAARIIKRAAGLNGVRGESDWSGDRYEFRPYRSCTVLFAWYDDSPDAAP